MPPILGTLAGVFSFEFTNFFFFLNKVILFVHLSTDNSPPKIFNFKTSNSLFNIVDRNALHSFSFVYCSCGRVLIAVNFVCAFFVSLRNVA